jgi:hypothetical protein
VFIPAILLAQVARPVPGTAAAEPDSKNGHWDQE